MVKGRAEVASTEDEAASEHDRAFGSSIREARLARGLSLQRVADAAGLSVGLLSQVERGISSPSVRVLRAICGALGVTVQSLFGEDGAALSESRHVMRPYQRRRLDLGAKGIVKEFLSRSDLSTLQIMEIILAPGGSSGEEAYNHIGEEGGVVVEGAMELVIDGTVHRLMQGDSFAFESALPHKFRNLSEGVTRVLWITTPPVW